MEGKLLVRQDEGHGGSTQERQVVKLDASSTVSASRNAFDNRNTLISPSSSVFSSKARQEIGPTPHHRVARRGWFLAVLFQGLVLITHAWLTISWRGENPPQVLIAAWSKLVELGRSAWNHGLGVFTETFHVWAGYWFNDEPLFLGEHARHWYEARLGIAPWRPVAWDPAVYGGYLVTPWWNSQGRWAALIQLWSNNWRAYKMTLLATVLLLPLAWWGSARCLGAGSLLASWSVFLSILAFWNGPGVLALREGDLDLVLASALIPAIVASWCAWQHDSRPSAALSAVGGLILLGWSYPLAGLIMFLVGLLWYLRVGARHSIWWHLGTLAGATVVGICYLPTLWAAYDTWWLLDGRLPERDPSLRTVISCWSGQDWLGAVSFLGAAWLGCSRGSYSPARRSWLIFLGLLILLGMTPTLPLPWAWQPARLAHATWSMWIVAASLALALVPDKANQVTNSQQHMVSAVPWRYWLPRIPAVVLMVGVVYSVVASSVMVRLFLVSEDSVGHQSVGGRPIDETELPAQWKLLSDWLRRHTSLQSAIAVEEDEEFLRWSPMLIASSGRLFANGLGREVPWAFHSFRWRMRQFAPSGDMALPPGPALAKAVSYLNGKPIMAWSVPELDQVFARHNVGWLLVRRPETAEFLLRLPEVRVVAHDQSTGWRLLARPASGYIIHGQGRLLRVETGSVTLADLVPESGRCRIRLTYLPGLLPSCDRCRLQPAQMPGESRPYWEVLCPGPQFRLTLRYQPRIDLGR
ncbi:MAG: hypothetical protein RMI91_00990 [Gemmatales bacterium]|nr:hypothetical protein [Gemmatales bacterium]MDW7993209.1 hypothetical protein [Gemmatales bacterium]